MFIKRYILVTSLVLLLPLLFSINTLAQTHLLLSSSRDFSTDDRSFSRTDTLFVKVMRSDIDYMNLKELELRLKPHSGGNDINATLSNNLDGTYTAEIPLALTDPAETSWELRIEVKDGSGHEFKAEIDLTIGANNAGDPPRTHNRIETKGPISEINGDLILVNGVWFQVSDTTVISWHGDKMLQLADLSAGLFVQVKGFVQADGTVLAIKIHVQDEQGRSEIEMKGFITAIGTDSVVVDGTVFFINADTKIHGHSDEMLQTGDLAVGMFVEVKGRFGNDGKIWAEKIKLENDDGHKSEFEFTGPIDEVTDTTVVVSGVTFFIDSTTQIMDEDKLPLTLSSLQPGMLVEAKGTFRADGKLWALRIKLEDLPGDEVELKGKIEAVTGNSITVNGIVFQFDSTTTILDHDKHPISAGALQAGAFVEVKARRQADGSLLAVRIKLEDDFENEVELSGKIENIESGADSSVTVSSVTFRVDASTVIWDNRKMPVAFSDLAVGQFVEIKGRMQADGTLLAMRIKLKMHEANEVEIKAAIDSLGANLVVAGGMWFTVDDNTIIMDNNKQPLAFADLQVSMLVEIKGRRMPDGSILALRIKLEDNNAPELNVRGSIASISGDTVVVEQVTFLATAGTLFLDRQNNAISLADFVAGEFVEAEASTQNADGVWLLKKLKKEDHVTVQGKVQSVAGSELQLVDNTVQLDANTLIVGTFNSLKDATQIRSGAVIEVSGTMSTAGKILASSVVISSDAITGVADANDQAVPADFVLEQNYPNPFNPETTLRFRIEGSSPQKVTLKIYNVLGQELLTLVNGVRSAGTHAVTWNGRDAQGRQLASGIYLARLQAGGNLSQVRRMVLSK